MTIPLRPSIRMLHDELARQIIDEAFELLARTGVKVESAAAAGLLCDAGAVRGPSGRILIPRAAAEAALSTVPEAIEMYDRTAACPFLVGGDTVHFDPGSAALRIHDHATRSERPAVTADVVRFARLTDRLEHFHFQSTGLISSDVPEEAADAYRVYLGLLWCSKPIVTGVFVTGGFAPMHAMLGAVRGGSDALRKRPLAIFDACPSPPLCWTNLTAQSLIDCARAGIPSELVAMPLTGATAPATLAGALVQHTAENLAGVAIAQAASPGAPVIFGGSPASFDMRTANAPMGAMETMMIDCAYAQIGKMLRMPTHAYMGLSDAKCLDTQAGLESGMGALLAALAGINVVSGGGMMDYETTQSLEKLVIDDEICAMAYRLLDGIHKRSDPIALDIFAGFEEGFDFLTHPDTLQWFREEQRAPAIIDRGRYARWEEEGKPTLADRAHDRVQVLLEEPPSAQMALGHLAPELAGELREIMARHAKRYGGVLPAGSGL